MSSASRAGLGIPRIDTNINREFGTLHSPSDGNARDSIVSRSSAILPSVRILASTPFEGEDTDFDEPESASNALRGRAVLNNHGNPKAKQEMRKLLSHVLTQLVNRRRPPTVADTIKELGRDATERTVSPFAEVLKDVAKLGKAIQRQTSRMDDEDDEEDGSQVFTTEATFDLMLQLKDLLSMASTGGWQIFEETEAIYQDIPKARDPSLLRRSRNSFSGRRSRSSSPTGVRRVQVPELLSLCIAVLSSIISEDCRFQIMSPRPSRPPNALQALSLTVAQFLIHTHRHDPKVISRVGFALIPAFSSFQPEMYGRLISFFEITVIRGVLESLRRAQGFNQAGESSLLLIERPRDSMPVVSIQVESDEAIDDVFRAPVANDIKVHSSSAPHQDPAVAHLSSLISPLMAAILDAVDLEALDSTHELAVRFDQLVNVITSLKVDAYNDLLAIVAYHTARSRKQACAILTTLWPKSIGHSAISRVLSIPFTPEWARLAHRIAPEYVHNKHQFTPWQFIHKSNWPTSSPQHPCSACAQPIHNFGLLCPFCLCAAHFDCYHPPEGSIDLQYRMSTDAAVQKVAMYRFSYLLPSRDVGIPLSTVKLHAFAPINLFTFCLCHLCRQPLWGIMAQAVKCTECSLIAHPTCCASSNLPRCGYLDLTSDQLTIDIKSLRRSATTTFTELRWTYDHLSMLSYEEVMTIYEFLKTQFSLVQNGITLSSFIVAGNGFRPEDLELYRTVQWCREILESQKLQRANATTDYMEENDLDWMEYSVLYDFSNLVYLTTALKSPISMQVPPATTSSDLLNVNTFDIAEDMASESVAHPYEVVPLSHLQDILNVEFNIHTPSVVKVVLNHLHHLSFLERLEAKPIPFVDSVNDSSALCVFPLPLGLDLSTDVETLVTAVEVCLLDLDLSVNEFAFLLLVRRFWPNGLMSDYGLKRITRSILAWIIAEDDNLATILRDYIAKQKPLPGVRQNSDTAPWPATRILRNTPDNAAAGNGRDYVQARRALIARYAEPWLLSLHNQNPDGYIDIVYDACVELAEDRTPATEFFDLSTQSPDLKSPALLNEVLYCISKVAQSSMAFSALDALVLRWLKSVTDSCPDTTGISGLHRIFPKDDSTGSYSVFATIDPQSPSPSSTPLAHSPFQSVLVAASRSEADLNQALRWLLMITRSAVELPSDVLERLLELVTAYPSNLDNAQLFAHTVLLSFWLKSLGRQGLQTLFSRLFSKFEKSLLEDKLDEGAALADTSIDIIRRSLAACSLIYGCERQKIIEMQLISEQEVKDLPSRKKLIARASNVVDPIVIDAGILKAISQWLHLNIPLVTSYVAKFLHLFSVHSPVVAPYEVDNFILRNSALVANCAWKFYGVEKHGIDSMRSEFLVRVLAVDAEPFLSLVDNGLDERLPWERRLKTVTRLARILNDMASPAFDVDGRQWRSSVAEVLSRYFALLWKDPNEEVRLSVRTVCTGLLPAQMQAISLCWNESLSKSSMTERFKLVAFLLQLRPHFPGWKLINWETLVDTMAEFDFEAPNDSQPHAARLSQANPDMVQLLVSSLLLGLALISDGLPIDPFSLLKIKTHLVKVLGFSDLLILPLPHDPDLFQIRYGEASTIPDIAFPCLNALVPLVDAPYTMDLPASITGSSPYEAHNAIHSVLIGHVFADVVFNLVGTIEKLESLPVLSLKSLLEAIYIILHKHDFEVYPTKLLQPLLWKTVDPIVALISKNINYEIRQLALTVAQAFLKRCYTFFGSIIPTILEAVSEMVIPYSAGNQDALITQGRSLILATLTSHSSAGLMVGLFKRNLKPSFFTVMKQLFEPQEPSKDPFAEPLPAVLLRDTLSRIAENDTKTMQNVINNLRSFVEMWNEDLSYELVTFSGQQITAVMRRLSDNLFESVDASPLLWTLALLVQGNRKHIRELLSYIETSLRIALTRGAVTSECLVKLIATTQPRIVKHTDAPLGKVISTLVEILSDAFRLKARVLPSTINASLTSSELPIFPDDPDARFRMLMSNMVENASYFLDHHVWADGQNDYTVSTSVARVVLQTLEQDPMNRQDTLSQEVEIAYRLVNTTRSWIILAIAALQEPERRWPSILFRHFQSFLHSYTTTMRPYAQSNSTSELATTDFNHGFIAIKIWLMLAQRTSTLEGLGDGPMLRVWNELWPVFDNILGTLETEAHVGLSSTLMVLATTSITDLFLFLQTLHAPMVLDLMSRKEVMARLKISSGDSVHLKINRTPSRATFDTSTEGSFNNLLQQAAKELIATEKLRMAESRREPGKVAGDRR